MTASKEYILQEVTSKDGTRITYKQFGKGKGIILIHGGLQASQNFTELATALSINFAVYVPDRRGRGLSGPYGENYNIAKDCEDIDAILLKTQAHYVFGLSSGALISMNAALRNKSIRKLAIYEPPLSRKYPTFTHAFIDRYEREMNEGKLAAAFVTIVKGLNISGLLSAIPRFITVPLFRFVLALDSKEKNDGEVSLKAIIPTFHYDNMLVNESAGPFEQFEKLTTETLLMNGSKTPDYLKNVIYELKNILPHAEHIEFKGLDHLAADNSGKPKIVAHALMHFFEKE